MRMLRPNSIILAVVVGISMMTFSFARAEGPPVEMVIHFNDLSVKDVPSVQSTLQSVPGITVVGYCTKLEVFMITYDTDLYSNHDYVLRAIVQSNENYKPVAMNDASHAQVQSNCQ